MLRGAGGEAVAEALRGQIEVGEFFGAERLVPVGNVHMMGDIEVMGDGGLEFLRRTAASGARCVVDTTTNARCFDFEYVERLNQSPEMAAKERTLISCLREMGVMTTDTCINYQALYQPHFGEHVAWGDTGTVIYANSVLGARSNFESGPAALAAALTGRTPAYGFHLDGHRTGNILVEVDANLDDLADWGAVGRLVGERHQDYSAVPVFTGLVRSPMADELKHLGASLASHGSMGMYHVVGVTPEARTVEDAFGGEEPRDTITVTDRDLEELYAGYDTRDGEANLVVFSAPQLSLYELKALSDLLENQEIGDGTDLIVTTNRGYKSAGERLGYLKNIERAGGTVLEGVCFYILDGVARMRTENGWDQPRHQLGQARQHHQGAQVQPDPAPHRRVRAGRRLGEGLGPVGVRETVAVERAAGPVVEGEALVSTEGFSPRYDLDRLTGEISRPGHAIEGANIAGKILFCPTAKGGIAAGWAFYDLESKGIAPQSARLRQDEPGDGPGRRLRGYCHLRGVVAGSRADNPDGGPGEAGSWTKEDRGPGAGLTPCRRRSIVGARR